MPYTTQPRFRKSLLAMAAGAALAPYGAWALDLAQEPPLPKLRPSFVAPNLIISLDDSGSMNYCLNAESASECILIKTDNTLRKTNRRGNYYCTDSAYQIDSNDNCSIWKGATNETEPITDPITGKSTWPITSRRVNVLKYSIKKVFNDKTTVDNNKIRLAWQAMWNNGGSPDASGFDKTKLNENSMRFIDAINNKSSKTHRETFLDFVDKLTPRSGTPSPRMFSQADAYLRLGSSESANPNGPWSSNPGGSDDLSKEYLGCRRNYHIMMTDGRWNQGAVNLPDSTRKDNATSIKLGYNGETYTGSDSNLYRDKSTGTTLADWAFYSWGTPLASATQLKETSSLKPPASYSEAPATETFGTTTLKKYWNPKYNPADWPHMVTYTIGFSELAYKWNYSSITAPTVRTPFGYDGSFPQLASGSVTWPDLNTDTEARNALDLWHAALNGRGRFYAVEQGEELVDAFKEIIGKINEESSTLPDTIGASSAASGFNTTRGNVGNFSSSYNGKEGWKGWITASPAREPITKPCPEDTSKTCTYYPDPTKNWEGKTTADRLDELTNLADRVVLSWSDEWDSTKYKGGVPFQWATDQTNLSSAQKTLLGKETSDVSATVFTKGENVLNYIRGDRTLEGDKDTADGYTTAKPFRERSSRQGDIINSAIWYTDGPSSNYTLSGYSTFVSTYKDRTPMLYVGGNDGMLHGFSAVDGKEKIAYVPRGVIGDLKKLADPKYNHQYFVDGSPMTGDVLDGSTWRTMLVGALGAGGKGYFVLDVTDPSSFIESKSQQLAVKDRTRGNGESAPDCTLGGMSAAEKAACLVAVEEDKDIGNITAQPVRDSTNQLRSTQIVRLNNNRWAAVMGNGYNSANQRPVLLVQYLDGSKELLRIQASDDAKGTNNAADNGLSAPTLVDLNGDGRTDIVYAGDNLGNLWKFDLTSDSSSEWKVAFGIDKPLFSARGPKVKGETSRTIPQPITAPAIVRANDRVMEISAGKTVAVGGMMVSFGTGRNLSRDDRDVSKAQYKYVQTLYSVLDNARYRIKDKSKPKDEQRLEIHPGDADIPAPKQVGTMGVDAKLAQQVVKDLGSGNETVAAVDAANVLSAATWKDYNGWYLDLPEEGERLLKPMQFWDGSNILAVYSEEPSGTSTTGSTNANESCTPSTVAAVPGVQYRTLINIMDGKKPSVQLVGGGVPLGTSRIGVPSGTPQLVTSGKKILDYTGVRDVKKDKPREDNRMPEQSLRPSWRQVK